MKTILRCLTAVAMLSTGWAAPLPGTELLEELAPADRSVAMVAGISKFLDAQAEKAIAERPARWARDFSSREAYEKSVQPMRDRLTKIIGAVEPQVSPDWSIENDSDLLVLRNNHVSTDASVGFLASSNNNDITDGIIRKAAEGVLPSILEDQFNCRR